MRLADFILHNIDTILDQWKAFAATLRPVVDGTDGLALSAHARPLLEAIAADLSRPQANEAQRQKSLGLAPGLINAPQTAAQTYGILRAQEGFDINQLTAEYRALRASVLRLWFDDCRSVTPSLDDVVRFNEAIDQALAESVNTFSAQLEQARNLFLGMLGHDLRSPLQTVQATAAYLVKLNAGERVSSAADRLIRTGARMQTLLDDLCDFGRTRLGLGIRILPAPVDMVQVFADELDQLRAIHPDRLVVLATSGGDFQGLWDGPRLQQLLGNLVLNAISYGAPDAPVEVIMAAGEAELQLEVRNRGPVLEAATLHKMFEPLERGPDAADRQHAGLGLGLFIARAIATAHGGSIGAHSSEGETVFTVRLPRQQPVAHTAKRHD